MAALITGHSNFSPTALSPIQPRENKGSFIEIKELHRSLRPLTCQLNTEQQAKKANLVVKATDLWNQSAPHLCLRTNNLWMQIAEIIYPENKKFALHIESELKMTFERFKSDISSLCEELKVISKEIGSTSEIIWSNNLRRTYCTIHNLLERSKQLLTEGTQTEQENAEVLLKHLDKSVSEYEPFIRYRHAQTICTEPTPLMELHNIVRNTICESVVRCYLKRSFSDEDGYLGKLRRIIIKSFNNNGNDYYIGNRKFENDHSITQETIDRLLLLFLVTPMHTLDYRNLRSDITNAFTQLSDFKVFLTYVKTIVGMLKGTKLSEQHRSDLQNLLIKIQAELKKPSNQTEADIVSSIIKLAAPWTFGIMEFSKLHEDTRVHAEDTRVRIEDPRVRINEFNADEPHSFAQMRAYNCKNSTLTEKFTPAFYNWFNNWNTGNKFLGPFHIYLNDEEINAIHNDLLDEAPSKLIRFYDELSVIPFLDNLKHLKKIQVLARLFFMRGADMGKDLAKKLKQSEIKALALQPQLFTSPLKPNAYLAQFLPKLIEQMIPCDQKMNLLLTYIEVNAWKSEKGGVEFYKSLDVLLGNDYQEQIANAIDHCERAITLPLTQESYVIISKIKNSLLQNSCLKLLQNSLLTEFEIYAKNYGFIHYYRDINEFNQELENQFSVNYQQNIANAINCCLRAITLPLTEKSYQIIANITNHTLKDKCTGLLRNSLLTFIDSFANNFQMANIHSVYDNLRQRIGHDYQEEIVRAIEGCSRAIALPPSKESYEIIARITNDTLKNECVELSQNALLTNLDAFAKQNEAIFSFDCYNGSFSTNNCYRSLVKILGDNYQEMIAGIINHYSRVISFPVAKESYQIIAQITNPELQQQCLNLLENSLSKYLDYLYTSIDSNSSQKSNFYQYLESTIGDDYQQKIVDALDHSIKLSLPLEKETYEIINQMRPNFKKGSLKIFNDALLETLAQRFDFCIEKNTNDNFYELLRNKLGVHYQDRIVEAIESSPKEIYLPDIEESNTIIAKINPTLKEVTKVARWNVISPRKPDQSPTVLS